MAQLERWERFKDARTVHNIHGNQTMDEVAAATGLSKNMISDLESEKKDRHVGYQDVAKLAKHYGVSGHFLLGLTEDHGVSPSVIDELGLTKESVITIASAAENGTIGQLNLLLAHHDLPTILNMLHKVSRAVTAELSHLKSLTAPAEKGAYFENLDIPGSKVYIADLGSLGLRLAAEHETEMIKSQILETHPELQDRIIIEYGRDAIARHIETISSLFKYLVWDTSHYSDLDNFYVDMWRRNNGDD